MTQADHEPRLTPRASPVRRFDFPRSFDLAEKSPVAPDDSETALMLRIIGDLHLKNRSLITDGYDESLEYLGRILPLEVFRFPTGYKAFTWTVPEKWAVREARIRYRGGPLPWRVHGFGGSHGRSQIRLTKGSPRA